MERRKYTRNTMRHTAIPLMLLLALTLASCTTVNVGDPALAGQSAASGQAGDASTGAAGDASKSGASTNNTVGKPWKDVTKDARAIDGFFRMHIKTDRSLLLEIQPEQLGMDFGFIAHYSKGTGVFNIHDGLALGDTRMLRFERIGETVYLRHMNTRFTADEGSPLRESLDDNLGHSIVAAFKIESRHDTTKALLIDFTSLIVSDYLDRAEAMKLYFGGRPVQFDKTLSYVSGAMGFPRNIEIDAELTYKPNGLPITSSAGVSDVSSVPLGLRYSFFALPENPMPRRVADDRVGFFINAQRDFSIDRGGDQMVRYVNRWRLEKKDPEAELSDPVEPIVYYIDRTVPHEYRRWVKEGIEGWRKAFEAAGFSNAIIAKEAPDDSTWSAEDMRYSTVRWSAAHQMGYAIGPSQTDPRTGEILNADVLLSSVFMSGWGREWEDLAGPNGMLQKMEDIERVRLRMTPHEQDHFCMVELGKQYEMGLMSTALLADGVADTVGNVPEEFYGPALRDLVFHEVGHTLGLRHNFRASASIPYERMQDEAYTTRNGLTLSVMDYAGTNINPDRDAQGHYVNMEVGSYDVWAISYGYTPDDEKAAGIARRAAHPLHAYNTDGDAGGFDPLTSVWDLSSDPMAFAEDQRQLVAQIYPVIEERLLADNDGYVRLRSAVNGLLFTTYRQFGNVAKLVGGSHFARDHKGDPDARLPMTPVPGAEQRAAARWILENALETSSLPVTAELLNKAAPSRHDDWMGGFSPGRYDLAIYESVLALQMQALGTLTNRDRLARMIGTDLRQDDPYTVEMLFSDIDGAVYSSLTGADRFQRNLQLAYVDHLAGIMNNERPFPFVPSAPDEARALARLHLTELAERTQAALGPAASGSEAAGRAGALSRLDRAHLLELDARIAAAFDLSLVKETK